jgi:hypothetical protein
MKVCISISLLFWGIFNLMIMTGCPDYITITYENQTSQPIQVDILNISPDSSVTPDLTWDPDYKYTIDVGQSMNFSTGIPKRRVTIYKYAIVAVNDLNENVFSKIYTWDELNNLNWTIVIKPE